MGLFTRLVKNYESYGNVLHLHAGAGLALDALGGLFKQRDECDAAGLAFGKRHGSLDLRQHGAGGELLFVDILARLVRMRAPCYTLPMVATMTALMVCMRFSASSKTLEFGERKTSSVTSRIS